MRFFTATGLFLLGTLVGSAGVARAQYVLRPANSAPSRWASANSASSNTPPASSDSDPTALPSSSLTESNPTRSQFSDACEQHFDTCADGCDRKWFGAAYALVMTRNRAPAHWLTNTVNDFFDLKMNSQNAAADWSAGGQLSVGYAWRGIGGPAVSMTYWGLTTMKGSSSVSDATGNPATALNSFIDFSGITINGNPGSLYFSSAQEQAVWRQDRTDNFELNFQTDSFQVGSYKIAGLAGFRYFRFSDNLLYGSASFGNSFASNGGADAAYLRIVTHNNLFGAQLGTIITSTLTRRLTFFAIPKVGAYGNQMNAQYQIFPGDNPSNFASNFKSHKADLSALAELDLGLSWTIHPNVLLTGGYRLVSVANLALADNQYDAYGGIAQNGGLILHGIIAGFTWTF